MEEYTENTEPETENSTDYTEENTAESTDGSGAQPDEPVIDTPEPESPESPENTENNTDSVTDNTVTDTENNASGVAGENTGNLGDSEAADVNLLERVETLLDVLVPETDGESTTDESGGSEPEISEHDTQTLETLHSINEMLSTIHIENKQFYTETLKYREEAKETQQTIINCLEINALLLIGTGFFVALECGGKFADIFFKRMREKE